MTTVYYGGDIITENENQPRAEAVVTTDGIITFVGSLSEARKAAGADYSENNLAGACLLPGFIDAHGHFGQVINQFAWAELVAQDYFSPPVVSIEQIIERLKKHAAKPGRKPGDPIIGYGYHRSRVEEKRHPNKFDLDLVSDTDPVIVVDLSWHIFVFNTVALRLLGVDANTVEDATTGIWRLPDSKEPSGVIQGSLAQEFFFNLPPGSDEEILDGFLQAQDYYFGYGVTTVCEGKSTEKDFRKLDLAAKNGAIKIDVVSFTDYSCIDKVLREFPYKVGEMKDHILLAGMKIISDGTLATGAYLTKPFEGTTDDYGLQYISFQALKDNVRKCIRNGWRFSVHCIGDAAVDKLLDACESVLDEPGALEGLKLGIINHGTAMRRDQIPRVKKLGLSVSLFPSATSGLFEFMITTIGRERASLTNPIKSAMDAGLLVTAHNDTPVLEANPLIIVWAATNRASVQTGATFSPEERITTEAALKLVTINVAKQFGIDKYTGSVEVGKQADFVVLDKNPLSIPPEQLSQLCITETVKNGVSVYKA
jgi:predicted amidohydrolase YtcJ